MRYAIGRVLWIVPTLVTVSVLVFWALAQGDPQQASEPASDGAEILELPLFYNANPRDIRERSESAMLAVASGDRDAPSAARLLARLGGAALPHVLPRLDELAPEGRARVALALAPVGRRMGVGSDEELREPEAAIVFWRRFWEDRAIDFRPAVARRSVERLAERDSAARRDEIAQLDTYALADLIRTLGTVQTREDVARVARLTDVLAHTTGQDWRVRADADAVDAARVAARWSRWWTAHGAEFLAQDGLDRLYAMVVETRYGKWATEAATNGLGVTKSERTVLQVATDAAPWTAWLVAWGIGGGYMVGLWWGLAAGARPGRLDVALALAALIAGAGPGLVVALSGAPWPVLGGAASAALVMVALVGALASRFQRAAVRSTLEDATGRGRVAFGASPWRAARGSWGSASRVLASLIGGDLPLVLTAAFVVEQAFGLPGLSEPTLRAVAEHDVAWLMALALASTTLVGVAQIVGDALLALADPRIRAVLSPRREAWE